MDITESLYVTSREEWRAWLEAHHESADEIWLVSYRKSAGKPNIEYSHAVEEALCFGWIDSIRKKLDGERLAQRYSPRRRGSAYSQINVERLRRLVAAEKVMPAVLSSVTEVLKRPFEWPADVMAALRSNEAAWMHFQRFPPEYQRIRIAYVEGARKRPEEFEKRLNNLLEKTARGKQFGFGIDDFYGNSADDG